MLKSTESFVLGTDSWSLRDKVDLWKRGQSLVSIVFSKSFFLIGAFQNSIPHARNIKIPNMCDRARTSSRPV